MNLDAPIALLRTGGLLLLTALAELVGCYLPYRWLRLNGSPWLLVPAAGSLALFVWLLSLHAASTGRVYAAYGGVYVSMALIWLRVVDGAALRPTDVVGACVALLGMAIIVVGSPSR